MLKFPTLHTGVMDIVFLDLFKIKQIKTIENEIIMFKTKMTLKQLLGRESVFLSLDLWRTIVNISY